MAAETFIDPLSAALAEKQAQQTQQTNNELQQAQTSALQTSGVLTLRHVKRLSRRLAPAELMQGSEQQISERLLAMASVRML